MGGFGGEGGEEGGEVAVESFELSCSLSLVAYNYSETSDKGHSERG